MESRITLPRRPYQAHVPEADGQPGLTLEWPENCQPAVDAALCRVELWLAECQQSSLWGALFIGRGEQGSEFQRIAYETAFFWRLQQRLVAQARG